MRRLYSKIYSNKNKLSRLNGFFNQPSISEFSSKKFLSTAKIGNEAVSLILWGHVHRCPMSYKLLNQTITRLGQKKIPISFCIEDAASESFEKLLEALDLTVKQNNMIMKGFPYIQSLVKRNPSLSHYYFSMEDRVLFQNALAPLLSNNSLSPSAASFICDNLSRHFGLLEKVELIKKLIKLKVSYVGIEPEATIQKNIYDHIYNPAFDQKKAWLQAEQFRSDFMVDAIFNSVLQQSTKGGVIFVLLGNNHVHRVAVNLDKKLQLMPNKSTKLFPLKLFSPYVMDGISSHESAEVAIRLLDTLEDQKAYESIFCNKIICEEDIKLNLYGSLELDKILEDAIEHVNHSNEVVISNMI